MQELQEPHASAEEEHGVTSFVFEARRPFHPERFAELLDAFPDTVVRSKGHFWLAGREEMAIMLNVAGQSVRIAPAGNWVATLPPEERAEKLEAVPELEEIWDDEWGDRGTQLVVIGTEMDHDRLRQRLDQCLLTDAEMDADWSAFEDQFPEFVEPEAETDDEQTPAADPDDQEEIGLAD